MKRVIVILMMLSLVSTVNAVYTNIPCEYKNFFGACQCRVDTNNANVSNMCDIELGDKYEVVPKGETELFAAISTLGGSVLFGISSFFAKVLLPTPRVVYNYAKVIFRLGH
jgi:hypothetical protein